MCLNKHAEINQFSQNIKNYTAMVHYYGDSNIVIVVVVTMMIILVQIFSVTAFLHHILPVLSISDFEQPNSLSQ